MISVFCCFCWKKTDNFLPQPGLVNQFSATPRGQLNCTGPIANSFTCAQCSYFVTGEHWTASPNKSIDQIGKNCPKNAQTLCYQPLQTIFGHFRTFFRHFSDILSTYTFSGLSNDWPVTTLTLSRWVILSTCLDVRSCCNLHV